MSGFPLFELRSKAGKLELETSSRIRWPALKTCAVDAKPTAGYDLAVVEFTVDAVGLGKGSMAPAAKVKPGGVNGIQVDDYSGKRIDLVTVSRNLS